MLSHQRGVRPHIEFSRSIKRDIDITDTNKNYARTKKTNKDRKSMQNTTKKEKVVTVKSVDIGLPGTRKKRALKEQIETFVEGMTPLKKSNTQQDTLNKGKLDEIQKHSQSKTKEVVTTKSSVSVLNHLTDEEEKATSNDLNPSPVNIEVEPLDKDSPVIVGDNLGVYYGDEQATTYGAKFIDMCGFKRAMKYYAHFKGWNLRSDVVHIVNKTKEPEPEPKVDNDTYSLKTNPPEHSQSKTKEVVTTKSSVSVLNHLTDEEEKATSNDLNPSPVNIDVEPFDKDSPVIVGDNLGVRYGDEQATTYDVKFIDMCGFKRAMKYYAHFKGWNLRSDVVHIVNKTKEPEPEPKVDNDTYSLKTNPPELFRTIYILNSMALGLVLSLWPEYKCHGSRVTTSPGFTRSTRIRGFHENTMPSTSKSVYYQDFDVNSELFCEETIPGSPTSTSEEQNNQEERKKAPQELYEEREAVIAIYAKNHSLNKSNTLMGATKEKKIEIYTNIFHNFIKNYGDGDGFQPNCDLVTAKVCYIHTKCVNNGIETEHVLKKMTSSQRQAVILAEMNKLQSSFKKCQKKLAIIDKRVKKIQKRKRKMAKATATTTI
ncbi:uncharacterized protein LOC132938956 [Metopolophium dirhodum]|uniref:uncharacterized protein LOC132938956 n=1 Tax=Metopolophium dirhodum TaxID=44670 RepID=UPI00298FBFCA|nr:uncharacterized protein LOC132938956 [Metopolophium dirhodum]